MKEAGMAGDRKPVKEAAALTYGADSGGAPVISALGRGLVAEKILEKAREFNVPVVADAMLAQALNRMDVGEEIPREFYAIVAHILAAVARMDREYGERISQVKLSNIH
jgi:flagellar biosynthesis protein